MLAGFLILLREGLEAALIIGIVLGALRKFNHTGQASAVWAGTGSAAAISLLVAIVLNRIGVSLEGAAEAIFEGIAMLFAAGLLTWMIFWMRQRARYLKSELEADVQRATKTTGTKALFMVAFLAVLREGIETALFLTAVTFTTSATETIIGSLLGLAAAVFLGWVLFATTVRLNLNRFFQVTGILLILFAAGLVAHGVHEFNEVGLIPSVIEHVWDTNHILDESSFAGLMLKALFGYNGTPSLTEVLAYVGYFVAIGFALKPKAVPVTARKPA